MALRYEALCQRQEGKKGGKKDKEYKRKARLRGGDDLEHSEGFIV